MSLPGEGQTFAERAAMGATAGDNARGGALVGLGAESTSESILRLESHSQMKLLLALAAGYDRIRRGDREAEAWLEILRGQDFADVKAAIIEHYSRSRFPVMPSDVLEIIEEG